MTPARALHLVIALTLSLALACGGSDATSDADATVGDVSRPDIEYPSEDLDELPLADSEVAPEDATDVTLVDVGLDAEPCEMVTSEFGYRDNCDGTVTDTNTGLIWEKTFQWAAGLDDAKRACVTSRTAGLKEWRLPTIDELRTLILGCPATAPTGGCVVHHGTATCEDHESSACFNGDCYGCAMNQGPVVNPAKPTQHCYMDATFDWYCNLFWSQTQVKPKGTGDKRSWYVTFYNAGIDVPPSMAQVQSSALRCVRGP